MNMRCVDGWLGHLWGKDGKCKRGCGASIGRSLGVETSVDDLFLSEVLSPARPVDPTAQRGSVRPLLRLVRGSRV